MTFEEFRTEWLNEEPEICAHTSGSTGAPKPLRLRKEAMRRSAARTLAALFPDRFGERFPERFGDYKSHQSHQSSLNLSDIFRDLRFHSCVAADYIGGKMMAVRAWESGARFTSERPSNRPLADLSPTERIDLLSVVPSQLENLVSRKEAGEPLPSIGIILVGGAPLPATLRARILALHSSPCAPVLLSPAFRSPCAPVLLSPAFRSHCAPVLLSPKEFRVFETYGMTETCSHIALREIPRSASAPPGKRICKSVARLRAFPHAGSQGFRPLPGIAISADDRGCLIIDIDGERFTTNDLVSLTTDGSFTVLGRHDNVIITGGLKVLPEQTEALLAPILAPYGITDFALTSRPHPKWGEELLLATTRSPRLPSRGPNDLGAEWLPSQDLREAMKRHLPPHCVPKAILVVPEIPRLPNGKLDRPALRRLATTASKT